MFGPYQQQWIVASEFRYIVIAPGQYINYQLKPFYRTTRGLLGPWTHAKNSSDKNQTGWDN